MFVRPNTTYIVKYYTYEGEEFEQPVLTENGTLGGDAFAITESTCYKGDSVSREAFNVTNPDSGRWQSNNGKSLPQSITFYIPNGIKLTGIEMHNGFADGAAYLVKDFTLYGSNDNTLFDELGSFTSTNTTAGDATVFSFDIETDNTYSYIKLEVTSCQSSSPTCCMISYSRLLGNPYTYTEVTQDVYEAYDGNKTIKYYNIVYYKKSRVFEQPVLSSYGTMGGDDFAVDNDSTAQCYYSDSTYYNAYAYYATNPDTIYGGATSQDKPLTYYVPDGILLSGFYFKDITYNSSYDYHIKTFEIQASNDNSSWTTLGEYELTQDNTGALQTFDIETDTSYCYIRFYPILNQAGTTSSTNNLAVNYWCLIGQVPGDVVSDSTDYDYTELVEAKYVDKFNVIKRDGKFYTFKRYHLKYLTYVPWVMPFLEEDGIMYNLQQENNYAVSKSSYSTAYQDVAGYQYPAYYLFRDSAAITDGTDYLFRTPNIVKNATGTWNAYDTFSTQTYSVTFFSPVPIHLETVSGYFGGIRSISVYASYDGSQGDLLGLFIPPFVLPNFGDYYIINSTYSIASGLYNGDTLYKNADSPTHSTAQLQCYYGSGGAYSHERVSMYFNLDETRLYKYITIKFTVGTAISGSKYYVIGGFVRSLILAGQILDDVDWTDNETYEWGLPRLSADYLTKGQLIFTDSGSSSNIAITASTGASSGVPMLAEGDSLRNTLLNQSMNGNSTQITSQFSAGYGWCPDKITGQLNGTWCLHLPYKVKISSVYLKLYTKSAYVTDDAETIQLYADLKMETPIGNPITLVGTVSGTTHSFTVDISDEPIITDKIVYHIEGTSGAACLTTHLQFIDAKAVKLSLTEVDSSNAQFLVATTSALPQNVKKHHSSWFLWLIAGCVFTVVTAGALGAGVGLAAAVLRGTVSAGALIYLKKDEIMEQT